jgi:hypothetical protein
VDDQISFLARVRNADSCLIRKKRVGDASSLQSCNRLNSEASGLRNPQTRGSAIWWTTRLKSSGNTVPDLFGASITHSIRDDPPKIPAQKSAPHKYPQ